MTEAEILRAALDVKTKALDEACRRLDETTKERDRLAVLLREKIEEIAQLRARLEKVYDVGVTGSAWPQCPEINMGGERCLLDPSHTGQPHLFPVSNSKSKKATPTESEAQLKAAIRAFTVDAKDAAGRPAPNGPAETACADVLTIFYGMSLTPSADLHRARMVRGSKGAQGPAMKELEPMTLLEMRRTSYYWEIPIETSCTQNKRRHWAATMERRRKERDVVLVAIGALKHPPAIPLPCVVTLTRIRPSRRRKLDNGDNLSASLKGIKDEVARLLGLNDADPRLTWRCAQAKGNAWAVGIAIEGPCRVVETVTDVEAAGEATLTKVGRKPR